MFEKEIKIITDFSLEKIKKLGAYFTIEQLNQSGLHPSIGQYISAELDFLIFVDRKELLQKSAFDYSGPEVVKYFNLISKEIRNTKKLSFEDAKNLILQAVSFTANFLVRPKWSLTKFIFNEDQLKAVDEIKLSLNYLYYYDYLKNVLNIYIEKKPTPNFSLIDFEVALNKIDKELFSSHPQKLIDNALLSISEFFSMGGVESNKISPSCVELFLKEKDLIDYLFRLRRALPVNARKYYELNEIRNIIYTPGDISKPIVLPSRNEDEIKLESRNIPENKPNEVPPLIKPEEKADQKIEDRIEPEIKIELEQKVAEQEIFNFEEDQAQEKPEIMETEEKAEEEPEGEPEEILFDKEDNSESLEEETETVVENVNSESDELDSLLEDEILTDMSSGDDLLNAFDSQLKALEEESDSLLSGDVELHEDNESQIPLKETQEENIEPITDDEEEPKIEVKAEEQNVIEEEIETEDTEEVSKGNKESEETVISVDSTATNNVYEKKDYRQIPQRERDLFSFLSNKEIEKVVTNVFNEDREDFANTMEKITECFTYDEATEILKSVFFSYRVNPYTRDAVTLTNAVSNYFSQDT